MHKFRRPFFGSPFSSVLLLLLTISVASPQESTLGLRQDQWDTERNGQAEVLWGGDSVTLEMKAGAAGLTTLISRQPLSGDFIAQVSFEMLDWQSGDETSIGTEFGIRTPLRTMPADEQIIRIGREWAGPMDLYRSATQRRQRSNYQTGGIGVDRAGQFQVLRRGGQMRTAYRVEGPEGGGWQTLQIFDMYGDAPMHPYFSARNSGDGVKAHPPVRIRFHSLKIQKLPPLKRAGGGAEPTGPAQGWAIYATGPGWLRVGPASVFRAEQKMKDEIWGGNSEEPLPKKLLKDGFPDREATLKYLCDHLTKVHVSFSASSTPKEVVKAIFDDRNDETEDKEYSLRLDGGNDPESVLAKGQEYDFAAEKRILSTHGLTPRVGFRKLWLVHATGHGTVDGDVKDDHWMLHNSPPRPNAAKPGTGSFVISDGWGGTIGYSTDKWEGPYRDNYGLARAMKRLDIKEIALYPPAGNYSRIIATSEIPDNPRDYGSAVPGVQPIVDPPELDQWVVYSVGDAWLRIGTVQEFEQPVKSRETLWAGDSDEVMQRVSEPLGKRFRDYEQALGYLCTQLRGARVAYFPTMQPREVVLANLSGRKYLLHLARSPDEVIAGYGAYNLGAELETLSAQKVQPVKLFQKQWLVHATGHGTYYGDVKDDLWMMVATEPKDGGVTIPDGQGGTFGYRIDVSAGPFQDSGSLINALKSYNLKSVRLYGEDRYVSVDDVAAPPPAREETPQIVTITPDKGEAGERFYVTLIAKGMKPGYRFRFGPGIAVSNETNLGKNPDGEGERWLATITVDKEAKFSAGS